MICRGQTGAGDAHFTQVCFRAPCRPEAQSGDRARFRAQGGAQEFLGP